MNKKIMYLWACLIIGGLNVNAQTVLSESEKSIASSQDSTAIIVENIIKRCQQVSGYEQWGKMYKQPYWVKSEIEYLTSEGKTIKQNNLNAVDKSANKVFGRTECPDQDNYSAAFAINGDKGWIRAKKGLTLKMDEKEIENTLNSLSLFGPRLYNPENYDSVSVDRKMIGEKMCTGIRVIPHGTPNNRIVTYYDDATGLPECIETFVNDKLMQRAFSLEYQRYADTIVLSSKTVTTMMEGDIKQITRTIKDLRLNCPLDDSLFTKESVKKAFKERDRIGSFIFS